MERKGRSLGGALWNPHPADLPVGNHCSPFSEWERSSGGAVLSVPAIGTLRLRSNQVLWAHRSSGKRPGVRRKRRPGAGRAGGPRGACPGCEAHAPPAAGAPPAPRADPRLHLPLRPGSGAPWRAAWRAAVRPPPTSLGRPDRHHAARRGLKSLGQYTLNMKTVLKLT